MIAVTGYNSKITQELIHLLPFEETIVRIDDEVPVCDRYFFCAGLLIPKKLSQQSDEEVNEAIHVNLIRPMTLCDSILDRNPNARICVMGSDSGYLWSYNGVYAAAKCALHRYIETKELRSENQQLVGIAPSIIDDAGMTTSRTDTENLERRRINHSKGRFIKSAEVAKLVHYLLYEDEGYISNTVIRMNGTTK
jgi:NAD(P)-dependent dehydrogenase (short-subunit alcohol dehydrogenase family)